MSLVAASSPATAEPDNTTAVNAPHHRTLGALAVFTAALIATGCASRDSYVGENHAGDPPPPPKLKQDPRFAKETLEAQKRLWWP